MSPFLGFVVLQLWNKVNPTHKEAMLQSTVLVFYPAFSKASVHSGEYMSLTYLEFFNYKEFSLTRLLSQEYIRPSLTNLHDNS